MAWLLKLASQAALAAIVRFVSKETIEDLMVTLIAQAARYVASKTASTEDDKFVERIIERAKANG